MHVDKLYGSRISMGHVCDPDKTVVFTKNETIILNIYVIKITKCDIVPVVLRSQVAGVYQSYTIMPTIQNAMNMKPTSNTNTWHYQLTHTNNKVLKSLEQVPEHSPKINGTHHLCHPCMIGK